MLKIINKLPFLALIILLSGCKKKTHQEMPQPATPGINAKDPAAYLDPSLTHDQLYNKVLGFLVGSAIGDALGAPTEMWAREGIKIEYGFVDSLDKVMREASPEGPWFFNLSAGGTTDDTRWKELTLEYLIHQDQARSHRQPPIQDSRRFAGYLIERYLADIDQLKAVDSFDPEPFEINARRMTWLQEWALVAKPYLDQDLDAYSAALNRFYGGDLSCAGMLYTPAIGAFYPGRPSIAYEEAYKLAIFDLGYARDLSSLTGAMVAAAMNPHATPDSILNVVRDIDPNQYFKSRLIGRTAYRILRQARSNVYEAQKIERADFPDLDMKMPRDYPHDSLYFARTQKAYELLEDQLQDVPFHAGEIFLVNLTALLFTEMDFRKALEFVINFGRDNDTTGAVTGAILGAYWGFDQLPPDLVKKVMDTNQKELGIDLEALAKQFTETIMKRKG